MLDHHKIPSVQSDGGNFGEHLVVCGSRTGRLIDSEAVATVLVDDPAPQRALGSADAGSTLSQTSLKQAMSRNSVALTTRPRRI